MLRASNSRGFYKNTRIKMTTFTASLSGAFGGECRRVSPPFGSHWIFIWTGLLATAILKMNGVGNLAGWRWIFVR